jgi:glycosyltransferase involved in cell wall biosynthesis
MKAGVTILICTYNGAERLSQTLRHIAAQQFPPSIGCELIVIDNASTDDSIAISHREWELCDTTIELRVITEPKAGLTFARETGFLLARYNYIVLCDDDNWLEFDYVEKAFALMEQHPEIGILGGQGNFVFEKAAPAWLLACNLYAGGSQAAQSGKVADHFVYGAGAVLRKSAYENICARGFVSNLTDRQGGNLSSGGDYELCYVLALAGYAVWYEASLRFDHFITANRLTLPYYLTYIQESSHCFSVLEPYKILLKTNNTSLTSFRWELFKSFWYHFKKMGILFLVKNFAARRSDSQLLNTVQAAILKQRLYSYRHIKVMKANFMKAYELQKQLYTARTEI